MQALRKKIPMPPSANRGQQLQGLDVGGGGNGAESSSDIMTGPEFVNTDEIYKV